MHDTHRTSALPSRPEYMRDTVREGGDFGVVEKPLTPWERIYNQAWVRKLFIVSMLALAWQGYASCMNIIDFPGYMKIPTAWAKDLPAGINWLAWTGFSCSRENR